MRFCLFYFERLLLSCSELVQVTGSSLWLSSLIPNFHITLVCIGLCCPVLECFVLCISAIPPCLFQSKKNIVIIFFFSQKCCVHTVQRMVGWDGRIHKCMRFAFAGSNIRPSTGKWPETSWTECFANAVLQIFIFSIFTCMGGSHYLQTSGDSSEWEWDSLL